MSVIEKLDALEGVRVDVEEGADGLWRIAGSRSDIIKLGEVLRELPAIRQAMIDAERIKAYRDATFDGNAVYAALDERATLRTSAENVADVLDALNRVARATGEGEGPEADSGGDRG